jgi:beta-galactosidase
VRRSIILGLALVGVAAGSPRVRENFNDGWKFARFGPMPGGAVVEEPARSPFEAGFDDSGWRSLDLPHDWGLEGPFEIDLDGSTGKLPWVGIGWYRKRFTLPAEDAGKRIFLDVDGAMMDAKVWLNGEWIGRWPYGYSSFRLDLSEHVRPGEENVLAIRLDNKDQSSRWYGGAGLYRDVWLVKTGPLHLAHNGVFAWTERADAGSAVVKVTGEMAGKRPRERHFMVHTLHDGEHVVARAAINVSDEPIDLRVAKPKLWSPDAPFLYRLRSELMVGDRVVDVVETPFGIRTFEFTADRGFFLNGKHVYLKGVCQHHDLGALGTAWNRRAAERQIEILQEMGCNSIRTAHNPPAPGLVELCDRMGIILQVEAFDTWDHAKRANDYARFFPEWHERDLRLMVRNFRNSPSVVMWSSGNEIPGGYQHKPDGWKMADKLRKIMKDEDPTRPVTMGNNSPQAGKHLWKGIDLFGYNYKPHLYEKFHQEQPGTPVYGSETASCVSSRGIYFFPVDWNKAKGFFDFHVSSYDLYAPPWAMRPDIEFEAQDKTQPWNFGEYVWTGFDYLGEPTPFNKDLTNVLNFHSREERERAKKELEELGKVTPPSRSSYFGIVDLAGMKKDRFYLYQARWRPELPVAHILPHWNWPERVGKVTPVHVYTSGDEAELFLNGKSLGRKKRGEFEYRLVWDEVKYEPGELKVIACKNGNEWAEAAKKTAGKPAALKLTPDRKTIAGDGLDLCYVTVDVVDADGVIVPRATDELQFKVEGAGVWVAADNGDPTDHVTFSEPRRKAFSGKCVAILRGKKGASGKAVLKVASKGLPVASVEVGVE